MRPPPWPVSTKSTILATTRSWRVTLSARSGPIGSLSRSVVFSAATRMLLRNGSTGGFEVHDISNNNITNTAVLGTVGLNWQVMGFGDFNGDGMTDMMLRNSSTGGFEVYNISNNAIINAAFVGTVGLNWQIGGFEEIGERYTGDERRKIGMAIVFNCQADIDVLAKRLTAIV